MSAMVFLDYTTLTPTTESIRIVLMAGLLALMLGYGARRLYAGLAWRWGRRLAQIGVALVLTFLLGGGIAYAQLSCPCVPGTCDPFWFLLGVCIPISPAPGQ